MKILDTVWMITCPPKDAGVIYCIGRSAKIVWDAIESGEIMGTRVTRAILQKKGYRARRVQICLVDKEDAK